MNTSHPDLKRGLIVFRAQLCEQANRFDEMAEVMLTICENYAELTDLERNLLSCAYKNVIGSRRTSWRVLKEILDSSKQTVTNGNQVQIHIAPCPTNNGRQTSNFNISLIKTLQSKIESELRLHCNNIVGVLDSRLLNHTKVTGESRVFYYKMKGDYTRYLCEVCSGHEQKEKANESLLAYKTASDKATIDLPPTHPVRLGLMLNFSVFYYEIMKSPKRAYRLAKQAFDDAIAELDTLSEESYRESTIIMQLLRDNLNLWQAEQDTPNANELSTQQS